MKEENNFFYNSFKDKKIGLTSIRELGEAGAYTLFKEKTKKYMNYLENLYHLLTLKMRKKLLKKKLK
jgi:hypothetical protein